MKHRNVEDEQPWYKQFWPWFIIALPASVVVAGFVTLYIAISNKHSMVDDQYYKEGMAINQRLEQDSLAAQLNMLARVNFDWQAMTVTVELSGDDSPQSLTLLLLHPVKDSYDRRLEMHSDDGVNFTALLEVRLQHSYYLRILPGDERWRLNGEVDFAYGNKALLSAQ